MRTPTDPCWQPPSVVQGAVGPPQKAEALREAYRRHAAELMAIEEQQAKFLLVMLGIFSVGATVLSSFNKADGRSELAWPVQIGLTLLTLALLMLWRWHTRE